jgi:hypothetical protein
VTAAWGFFFAGLLCAIIYRVLLVVAAFRISVGWGLGIFLPFGPLFFRLSYPEEAARSMWFRFGTIFCFGFSLFLGPKASYKHPTFTPVDLLSSKPTGYGLEKSSALSKGTTITPASLDARRAANAKELERLKIWAEQLRLRKRDLLHSDTEGNRVYAVDLALYTDALTRATAEKNTLAPPAKK